MIAMLMLLDWFFRCFMVVNLASFRFLFPSRQVFAEFNESPWFFIALAIDASGCIVEVEAAGGKKDLSIDAAICLRIGRGEFH